jgi:ubiquinone/menaquinone biosynthesis C-methylase UbiE
MVRKEIIDFYSKGGEIDRLYQPNFIVEGIRTKQIIERYLDHPNMHILDIGGGAGHYAFWLQQKGHRVTLIDISPEHIEAVKAEGQKTGLHLEKAEEGNATDLQFNSDKFDLVLMLGPLYHLTEKSARIQAIKEAGRVLKPGCTLIIAIISRYASLIDGFNRDLINDDEFFEVVHNDLATGIHENPTNNPQYFTTAYFHKTQELAEEIHESGLKLEKLIAVESFGWFIKDIDQKVKDESYLRKLLGTISAVESNPDLLAISPHIAAVVTK